MKTALIAAFCVGALVQYAPSDAAARPRYKAPPAYELGSVPFKKLPKPAREALLAYRRMERAQPYRCYGLSEKRFVDRLGLFAPTDYNGDGVFDYLFNSPCRPRDLEPAADLLLSNPLGYQVSRRFDAFVDVVNGQPALLVETPCEDGSPEAEDGRACYMGRIWDRSLGHFAGAQRVSLAADGSGFLIAPLEQLRRPPPTPVIVVAPIRQAPAPAPAPVTPPTQPAAAAPQTGPTKPAPATH